jgi:hypothetical protein
MAQIDASIPLGVRRAQPESPLNAMAKVLQIQGLQDERAARQQGLERTNRLNQVLSQSYAKPEDREEALLRGGFVDQATKLATDRRANLKTEADTEKTKFDTASKRLEIMGQAFGSVRANPTLANAHGVLDYLGNNGVMTPDQVAQYKAQVAQNPQAIASLADQAFRAALHAKEQLATIQTRNTGGSTDTIAVDPVTGQAKTVNSVRNTVSPDAALSASTQRRGQNMVDARAREATAATMTKPFEVTGEDGKPVLVQQDKQGNIRPVQGYLPKQGASKPLTEGQAKAALFGSRMQSAEDIFTELADKGVTTSIPGSRTGYGVGATINALQPGERQRLDQAKRDFINAVLRRESGAVISQQEFDNAELQYFPQPGETPAQKAQKKANRELATRGILAEVPDADNRVAKIRGTAAPKSSSNVDALLEKYK